MTVRPPAGPAMAAQSVTLHTYIGCVERLAPASRNVTQRPAKSLRPPVPAVVGAGAPLPKPLVHGIAGTFGAMVLETPLGLAKSTAADALRCSWLAASGPRR